MTAHLDLTIQCKIYKLPVPVAEYRFSTDRKWRVDYAWPDVKLAVEVEGGAWINGRHNRGFGFLSDMSKYNEMTLAGWSLLRFTPGMVNSGEAMRTIKAWFERRR